jgi:L,D-transpeptidase ErfK/SrfK
VFFITRISEADTIIGGETLYTVQKGDSLEFIGAKLGTNWKNIVRDNNFDIKKPLKIGLEIKVNTRKIVPAMIDNGILINIPEKMLYFFEQGRLRESLPVGLGRPPDKGPKNFNTPQGKFTVVGKEKNPVWYVPESIQAEMEMEGKDVKKIVQPGPDNPLGRYAIKISMPGILIHETIWPSSVYQFRSHGCIRVMPEHMEKLFSEVEINTPGELIYKTVKVAVTDYGKIFLEVHKDAYGKVKDLKHELMKIIDGLGVSAKVDWQKIDQVLKNKSGIAEDITL